MDQKVMTQKEREEELYLIMSFPTWPHYPVCPMVNKVKKAPDGLPDVGFLLGEDVMTKKAVIYHENFVNLGRLKEMGVVSVKDFEEKIKKTEYIKTNDQMRLGEYVPTPETENKSFQEDSHGNFRIFVEGKLSQWEKYNEIAFLKVEDRIYIGVTDFYRYYLPKRCALKVEIVDEDGETNFYKFKIIDLVEDTILDRDDVEDLLREPSFSEEECAFNIKESKLKDFVKIAITEFGEFHREHIMTKEDVEEYLKGTLPSEDFDVINEDGEKINTR